MIKKDMEEIIMGLFDSFKKKEEEIKRILLKHTQ